MLRRANIYGACIACGLYLLLLLAGSRYGDNPTTRSAYAPRRSIKHLLRLSSEEADEPPPQLRATDPLDSGSNVERILDLTRTNISSELANLTFGASAGVRHLEDLIPERGGRPLRNIIVSTWRSGTTFLGEVLNAVPGNYYHYEPLLNYEIVQIRGPPHSEAALQRLRSMLECDFSNMQDYFTFGSTHLHQFNHNTRLWAHCLHDKKLCLDPDFMSRFCRLFPFQSMKLVRLRLRLVEDLLADPALNVKVVLLVRDPRAVVQSRQHRSFCRPAPDCWEPALLCADMVSDYVAAGHLLKLYPHKFMVLRYEDLALDTDTTAHALMSFLELGEVPGVDEFLKAHTNRDVGGVSSTFRISKEVPFRWKNVLKFENVSDIQLECKEAMSHWGYRNAHNATHLASKEFVPLEQYTVH